MFFKGFFPRCNLAKLHCALTQSLSYCSSNFPFFPVLYFCWFFGLSRFNIMTCATLCRSYFKGFGDQALKETLLLMISRWRKGSVETRRPVSSTTHPPPHPLLCPSYLSPRYSLSTSPDKVQIYERGSNLRQLAA